MNINNTNQRCILIILLFFFTLLEVSSQTITRIGSSEETNHKLLSWRIDGLSGAVNSSDFTLKEEPNGGSNATINVGITVEEIEKHVSYTIVADISSEFEDQAVYELIYDEGGADISSSGNNYEYILPTIQRDGDENINSIILKWTINNLVNEKPELGDILIQEQPSGSGKSDITSNTTISIVEVSANTTYDIYVNIMKEVEEGATYELTFDESDIDISSTASNENYIFNSSESVKSGAPTFSLNKSVDLGVSDTDLLTSIDQLLFTANSVATNSIYLVHNASIISSTTASGGDNFFYTSSLGEGMHTFYVFAEDVSGNFTFSSDPIVVTVDLTPPSDFTSVELSSSDDSGKLDDDNITNVIRPIFIVKGLDTSDPNYELIVEDVNEVVYFQDNYTVSGGESNIQFQNDLADGDYLFDFYIKDEAGNVSNRIEDIDLSIDNTNPELLTLSISSENNNGIVEDNEKVNLFFSSNEVLDQTKISTKINGSSTSLTLLGGNDFSTEKTFGVITSNSDITYEVIIEDIAGNKNTYTSTLDGTSVELFPSLVNKIVASGSTEFCVNSDTFSFGNEEPVSKGAGDYSYKWERLAPSSSWTDLGVNTELYTEYQSLPTGDYQYRRIVTSAGISSVSNVIDIKIYPEIENNEITVSGENEYVGVVSSINFVNSTGNAITGGDNTFTYLWEISTDDGDTWNEANLVSADDESLLYEQKNLGVGEYLFRRKISSQKCTSYSNEVEIIVFNPITNFNISNKVNSRLCSDESILLMSSSSITGGDGSFTYEWEENINNSGYSVVGVSENFYNDNTLAEGEHKYRRSVYSSTGKVTSNVITIQVENKPNSFEISPVGGTVFSNESEDYEPLIVDNLPSDYKYYCSGPGVISNGYGEANNSFRADIAGEGNKTIIYHISNGICDIEETKEFVVINGANFIASTFCESDAAVVLDEKNISLPSNLDPNDYSFQGFFGSGVQGNSFNPSLALSSNINGGDTETVTIFATYIKKEVIGTSTFNLPQKTVITSTPNAPTVVSDNFEYCYGASLSPLVVNNPKGTINWYDAKTGVFLHSGNEYTLTRPSENEKIIQEFDVREQIGSCEGPAKKVKVTFYEETVAPVLADNGTIHICSGDAMPVLKYTNGVNVNWYSDDQGKILEYSGNNFVPSGDTNVASDDDMVFYASSTNNGCESELVPFTININKAPSKPVLISNLEDYCSNEEIGQLSVNNEANTIFEWFDNENLITDIGDDSNNFTPSPIEVLDGSITKSYWVRKKNVKGCEGEALKIDIKINAIPIAPVVNKTIFNYCSGDPIEEIKVTKSKANSEILWFDDSGLNISKAVNYLPPVSTNTDTDVTYKFLVREESEFKCTSEDTEIIINVYALPEAPETNEGDELEICSGDDFPTFTINKGENVIWFSDPSLDINTKLHEGLSYTPTSSSVVTEDEDLYIYAVSTSDEGCYSEYLELLIEIKKLPNSPNLAAPIMPVCEGDDMPILTVNGEDDATFTWYKSEELDGTPYSGESFDPEETASLLNINDKGAIEYFVVQTSDDGCTSPPLKVEVPINVLPSKPTLTFTEQSHCFNTEIVNFEVTSGNQVNWYHDEKLKELIGGGDKFKPEGSVDVTKTYIEDYYVTQVVNGCEGPYEKVTITIFRETDVPSITTKKYEYCSGDVIQPINELSADGDIKWYNNEDDVTPIFTGPTFVPQDNSNVTETTDITYYVSRTFNGCESTKERIDIKILSTPSIPTVNSTNINLCSGETITPIIVTSTSQEIKWYDENDIELSTGITFTSPENTTVSETKVLKYYLRDWNQQCSSPKQEVTITINPLPSIDFTGIDVGEKICRTVEDIQITKIFDSPELISSVTSTTGLVIVGENIKISGSPIGDHDITFTFTNTNNCVSSITKTFSIVDVPEVNFSNVVNCDAKIITFSDETVISSLDKYSEIISWEYDVDGVKYTVLADEADSFDVVFQNSGVFDVSLTIATNHSCETVSITKQITISEPPTVNFSWKKSQLGTPMEFTDNSISDNSGNSIISYSWDFGDNSAINSNQNPTHIYSEPGIYNVELLVETSKGCTATLTKEVFVLPYVSMAINANYLETFDWDNGHWVPTSDNGTSSWEYGQASGTLINSTSNVWATSLNGDYEINEISYLNSPVFNLQGLSKPMLSFDMKLSVEKNIDGVTFQYSTDFGATWQVLGNTLDPINWFNSDNILSDPGDQILNRSTRAMGWSGLTEDFNLNGEYIHVKHHLDELKGEENVRFRLVFKSNSAITEEGILIDNFEIRNRSKVVLIENMANVNLIASDTSIERLENTLEPLSDDILIVNYHLLVEGYEDKLNTDNPEPVSGRKLYYGVSSVPETILDGNSYQGSTTTFIDNNQNYVYSRSMLVPEFDIDVNFDVLSTQNTLNVALTSNISLSSDDAEIVFHAITVEHGIDGTNTSGSSEKYNNILKTMSPSPGAEGTSFKGRSWDIGSIENFSIEWERPYFYNDKNVELILLVQNNLTKEIYQTQSYDLNGLMPLNDNPLSVDDFEEKIWSLYPNPATDKIIINSPNYVADCYWVISDINGKSMMKGEFTGLTYTTSIKDLPSGMYIIRHFTDKNDLLGTPLKFIIRN
ncbi:Ig-like domain-containing protein [Flammeovirga kamogawensis]|uniref:PKD domain-containing protein n=1 Tax=Flammeovirga kamogawensis TaxID=373891 RepID=A0ABX8GV76_9BACT|nr:Ig-like domain-containing protein [Flammeovirga kamogawensis]MBB6461583.1 PKD repeat protein [Flammeovirga kamogawensis]QWG07486.1 PKD domain-containing protein [Flammeovirga kamogawensis]TRX69299.1 PKD domain-containing protein [Flammeovirga kamogawensis]